MCLLCFLLQESDRQCLCGSSKARDATSMAILCEQDDAYLLHYASIENVGILRMTASPVHCEL